MSGSLKRFEFIYRSLPELFLLLFQGILFDGIPEGRIAYDLLRKTCHVVCCYGRAHTLEGYKNLFFSGMIMKIPISRSPAHCKRMRKFGTEDVDDIRSELVKYPAHPVLKSRIIVFRMNRIFVKAIIRNLRA